MAMIEAPDSIDITDIQFKLNSKYQLFNINAAAPNFNGIDLLATASSFGLIIVGRPATAEIDVLQLKDVIANKDTPSIPIRSINIPGEPYALALSCDHAMLSVCYKANGMSFMDIYVVQTFLSSNVRCFQSKIMVSNSDSVRVKQLLWNPVIANTLAICLSDGTLATYVFKETSFEYNSLDKSENSCCACWSPKGKQIVVAFPNGKLAQYKPDLKLAKTIPCTVPLLSGPFLPIAIQWLSTFQFAVVFIEGKEDAAQSLFIINAPKNAPPTYINYYDITYSQTGPRAPQVFLIHILQWNILLMGSSNGTEIGILGTTEAGETPLWKQYTFVDEGRAELPLTDDKQDTFPIGLALETGCTHQVVIGETQYPVMPMLHIFSTHGFLLSFNFLNFQPTRVDICSPPRNLADQSGLNLFRPTAVESKPSPAAQPLPQQQPLQKLASDFQPNLTFDIAGSGATSTPAKAPMMQKPIFGLQQTTDSQPPKSTVTNLFGSASSTGFGNSSFGLAGKEAPKPIISQAPSLAPAPAPASVIPQNNMNTAKVAAENNKPYLTVSSTYKPTTQTTKNVTSSSGFNSENDAILRKLIKDEIDAFDKEIRETLGRSKKIEINISSKGNLLKNIDEMQEITKQATESTDSIKSDVQSLRLTLLEMHAMLAEAQSKVEEFNKAGKSSDGSLAVNQTPRRLVNKLQNQLGQNQARFDIFSKQLDAIWSAHLQNQRENDKARMRIPSLENVYQTLEKQQQILLKGKERINSIKAKIGGREASPSKIKYSYSNTDNIKVSSLADSVLSMTLGDQIKNERKILNADKLNALRSVTLKGRPVNFVRPSRPDRKGLNSEIIIEKKIANVKAKIEKDKKKEAEKKAQQELLEMEAQKKKEEEERQKALTKPKPLLPTPQTIPSSIPAKPAFPTSQPNFSAPQSIPCSIPVAKPVETKPLFGDKTQSSFGFFAEKTVPKVDSTTSSPFSVAATIASSGASMFSSKPFGSSSPSTGFQFATASTDSGVSSQNKPIDIPTASKPVGITAPAPEKPKPSLTTPPNIIKKDAAPISLTPNIAPQKTPLLATPPQPPSLLSNLQPSAAPTSSFKFDTGNVLSSAIDKTKNDKENIPIVSSVPITKTNSPSSFSFGGTNISTAPLKSNMPTVSAGLAATTITPVSVPASTPFTAQAPAPTSTLASSTKTSATDFSFTKPSGQTSIFGGSSASAATTTNVSTANSNATVSSTTDPSSIFQNFNICKPNVADNSSSGKSLFSTNSFGSLSANATSPTNTATIFGSSAANIAQATSAQTSIFGGKSVTTSANASVVSPTNTTTGIFGGKSSDVFGAKSPDASAIQPAPASNIFGSKTVENASLPFSSFNLSSTPVSSAASNSPASAGNIFAAANKSTPTIFGGGGASNTSATSTASIFGGGSAAPTSPSNTFGSSIFGNTNTSTNVFGGASSPANSTANATSPQSGIFGGASNPASGGSLFGGSTGFGSPQQPTTGSIFASTGFGSSGGAFGQQSPNATSTSTFGGGFSQTTSNAPSFGSPAPAFGSPFGQAQNTAAFGSPQQQQQQSAGFGLGAIQASANPTFGSATFGSAATFGSPKGGFGTFASMNTNTSFSSPQKNTLFESLGSSENSAMTFGNLAQNQNPAAPKPFSGGSSFSSWR